MRKSSVLLFQFRPVQAKSFFESWSNEFNRRWKQRDFSPISVRFSGLCLIIYAKVSFRFRAIIKCVAKRKKRNERWNAKLLCFCYRFNGFSVRRKREMDVESQQVSFHCPMRTRLLSAHFFANVKFLQPKSEVYEGQRVEWRRKLISFFVVCTLAATRMRTSFRTFSFLTITLRGPGGRGRFPSTEIFCRNTKWN